MRTVKIFFGCFLAMFCFFCANTPSVYAEPVDEPTHIQEDVESATDENQEAESQTCQESLGALGWLVCPTTGVLSKAIDRLYNTINDILIINPISMDDGSPIYEIWKYCRGLTNIIFSIFLLIVIYSQLTGFGISNYGIKKALPKLIIAAILVNLSFIICSVCVDISNIVGTSVRGLFTSIEEATMATTDMKMSELSFTNLNAAIAGGGVLAIAGTTLAVEYGTIWLLIPVVLGAIVAVVSGLITIALRQAVVALLVMISPLAFVALILPNTESLFKKWKNLLYKMLIFYPTFSFLFGASNLAGWAIIVSAKNIFAVLLGVAVQVFPLFFAWKLMSMSGTFLAGINGAMLGLASRPLAANRGWANSHRELKRQKHLANSNMPSARLNRFLADRRASRELEAGRYAETNKTRGTAYYASRNYNRKGQASKKGKRAYELQARDTAYQQIIIANQNNMNRGMSGFSSEYTKHLASQRKDFLRGNNIFSSRITGLDSAKQLASLDAKNIEAADLLKYEITRGAKIDYENAKGYQERTNDAINAHIDLSHNKDGKRKDYKEHPISDRTLAEHRYNNILNIMEGKVEDTHYIGADAAYSFNSQAQIVQGKFQKYFSLGLPSVDIVRRLQEFTLDKNVKNNMDVVIPGLRILNQYGDTNVVKDRLYEIFEDPDGTKKIDLGTYASQSLASFCMFDVKDSDPILRRFGKYINVETARIYNEAQPEKRRHNSKITFNEYINGEYEEYDVDAQGNVLTTTHMAKPKFDAARLLEGTSFKGMERTAIANMTEAIRNASYEVDANGNKTFNMDKFKETQEKIWGAIMPNIIGDQFAFLSGSEQIKALAKGITGMDVDKHSFDWDGIFGKEVASSLTNEQKKDYMDFLGKRTKSFLNGHVPNQLARTKTDMLLSVLNYFTMAAAAEEDSSVLDESKFSEEQYKRYEQTYGKEADDKFRDSFKEETLKGFAKMYQKGYQGDTKSSLAAHLHPDELYKKFFGSQKQNSQKRRNQQHLDDDEGMVINHDEHSGAVSDSVVRQSEIEKIYMSDQLGDARVFYAEVSNYLGSSGLNDIAQEFEKYYHNNSTASRADLFNYLKGLL